MGSVAGRLVLFENTLQDRSQFGAVSCSVDLKRNEIRMATIESDGMCHNPQSLRRPSLLLARGTYLVVSSVRMPCRAQSRFVLQETLALPEPCRAQQGFLDTDEKCTPRSCQPRVSVVNQTPAVAFAIWWQSPLSKVSKNEQRMEAIVPVCALIGDVRSSQVFARKKDDPPSLQRLARQCLPPGQDFFLKFFERLNILQFQIPVWQVRLPHRR